jgi:hypothetical protein
MNFQQRVETIVQLGQKMREWSDNEDELLQKAFQYNPWFTIENTKMALEQWSNQLIFDQIETFARPYQPVSAFSIKTIAIIMAGNIPLVGLHDLLCVFISGHKALVKMSDDDNVLMKAVITTLHELNSDTKEYVLISEERLPKNFDAVIATGSNNTNRYFEYYFKNKPSLLRRNRNSVAVLTGKETPDDYIKLGADIFTYFGLGCRNVSKVYLPEGSNMIPFYDGIEPFNPIIHHHKYSNNYTYHKALFLMNLEKHLDNGFLLVKEDEQIASPLSVLFYEYYKSIDELSYKLERDKDQIQCVVSSIAHSNWIPLGQAQCPNLYDFADGVNTMKFIASLN